MCGIAGFFARDPNAPPPEAVIRRMAYLVAHRGPDGEGFFFAPGIALAHRRLAILDLEGGAQPLWNEDRTVGVVFNGEIENYLDLTRVLTAKRHRFATRSDTEVLVHAYETYGEAMLESLRGFFAFALWDARERRLLLARDRLGEKPLYFIERPEGVWFASEAKALLAIPGFSRRLDPFALDAYLAFLHVPYERTFFEGIRKVLPAEVLRLEEGRVVSKRTYWRIPEEWPHSDPAEFAGLFREVVARKLQSDVPVGVFLSGGIDSGLVAAEASRCGAARRDGDRVLTFTMGVEGDPALDERELARLTAEHIGAEGVFETQAAGDFARNLPRYIWHNDEPTGGAAALALADLAMLARRKVKVALAGDGGDEAFAGYPRHLIGLLRADPTPSHLALLVRRFGPSALVPFLRRLHHGSKERFTYDLLLFWNDASRTRVLSPDLVRARGIDTHLPRIESILREGGEDPLRRLQILDWSIYLPSTLHPADRMTMAAGLESRAPFLDHEIVSFAANLSPGAKLEGPTKKPYLRRALPGHLPEKIWRGEKRGFPTPMKRWFRDASLGYVRGLLLGERARARGWFEPKEIERILAVHRAGRDASPRIFQLASVEAWARVHLDPATPPATAEEAVATMRSLQ